MKSYFLMKFFLRFTASRSTGYCYRWCRCRSITMRNVNESSWLPAVTVPSDQPYHLLWWWFDHPYSSDKYLFVYSAFSLKYFLYQQIHSHQKGMLIKVLTCRLRYWQAVQFCLISYCTAAIVTTPALHPTIIFFFIPHLLSIYKIIF